jgi:signal transduction histidine kinase
MNNACYAVWKKAQTAPEDYHPEVNVSVEFHDGNIVIKLQDNGEGMSEETKKRLFETFYTTKPIGEGTGLGMAITLDIIENRHGGKLTFESSEGQGATFIFTIPAKR